MMKSSLASRRPKFGFDELTEEKINIIKKDTAVFSIRKEASLEPIPEIEEEPEPVTQVNLTLTSISDLHNQESVEPYSFGELSGRSTSEMKRSEIEVKMKELHAELPEIERKEKLHKLIWKKLEKFHVL